MHWDIEPPTVGQTKVLLEQARAQGRETLVNALLKQLVTSDELPPLQTLPEGNAIQVDPVDVAQNWQVKPARANAWLLRWLLPISVLLILSGIVLTQLYGGFSISTRAWESIKADFKRLSSPQSPPASAAPGTAPIPSVAVAVPYPATLPSSQATPGIPLATASAAAIPEQAVLATAPPAPTTSAPATKSPPTTPIDIAPKEEVISTIADQLRAGHAWILSMPTDIFLVLYSTKSSYAAASTWIKDRPELDNLHIVANYTSADSDLKYSIVSGPFDSRLEATRFAKGADMPKSAWAMPVKLMADRLSREPKAAAAKAKVTR
jgi:hypothetical protein